MLKLQISGNGFDVADGWTFNGDTWSSPCGWIEPFDHEALEHQMAASMDGAAAFLVVRERASCHAGLPEPQPGMAPQRLPDALFQERRRAVVDWPLGFTIVDLDDLAAAHHGRPRGGRVRIGCGANSAAPLQLTVHGGALHASWDPLDLAAIRSADRLNIDEVTRFLSMPWRPGDGGASPQERRMSGPGVRQIWAYWVR